jgi:hypothetical protein
MLVSLLAPVVHELEGVFQVPEGPITRTIWAMARIVPYHNQLALWALFETIAEAPTFSKERYCNFTLSALSKVFTTYLPCMCNRSWKRETNLQITRAFFFWIQVKVRKEGVNVSNHPFKHCAVTTAWRPTNRSGVLLFPWRKSISGTSY